MFEDKFFVNKKVNCEKLISYGFCETADGFRYSTEVMDGQFLLNVFITSGGAVTTQMIDTVSEDEYTLHKIESSVGAYVGEVRSVCEDVLGDISQKCFEPDVYHSEQTHAVINYVRERFGDELEFLWKKFDDNAIWRRKDTQKWYGLVLTIPRSKLGLNSDEVVEIIVLRIKPEQMAETVDNKKYFPGWHMSKKSWYTIILDGSVPSEEIFRRIDESYDLARK